MTAPAGTPSALDRAARALFWLALAGVAFVALSPIADRPVTPFGPDKERFAAFALLTALFALGYPRHRLLGLAGRRGDELGVGAGAPAPRMSSPRCGCPPAVLSQVPVRSGAPPMLPIGSARLAARLAAGAALLALLRWGPAAAQEPVPEAPKALFVMDNDFAGPGGTDMQAVLPLISDPRVAVLGLTVVTGDGWENEEAARLLRFLEIAGRPDIPVVNGAVYPLMRTVAEMRLWEQRYGKIPWKGAWGGLGSIDKVPATEPSLPHLDEGLPTTPPANGLAANFLVKTVHAHPHQVTVIAAGPLTNIALAIRMDPSFAADAKQFVFMGGLIDTSAMTLTGNADYASDFNLIFDPEAAHIVLTAPWPKITAVGNVSNTVMMDRALMDRVAAVKTPLTAYLAKYFNPLPLWDEMAAAIAVDPSLVTASVDAYMDVDVSGGADYGRARVWPDALAPKDMGVRPVTIVQSIDTERFVAGVLKAAQWTPPK